MSRADHVNRAPWWGRLLPALFALLLLAIGAGAVALIRRPFEFPERREPPTTLPASQFAVDDLLHYWDPEDGCFRLDAEALTGLYRLNPVEAMDKIGERDVEVSGSVDRIELGPAGGLYVHVGQVKCGFDGKQRSEFDGLRPGQTVVIRGWGGSDAKAGIVCLYRCRFVRRIPAADQPPAS